MPFFFNYCLYPYSLLFTYHTGYDVYNSVIRWHLASIEDPASIWDAAFITSFMVFRCWERSLLTLICPLGNQLPTTRPRPRLRVARPSQGQGLGLQGQGQKFWPQDQGLTSLTGVMIWKVKQEAQLSLRNRASAMHFFVAKSLCIAVITYNCV